MPSLLISTGFSDHITYCSNGEHVPPATQKKNIVWHGYKITPNLDITNNNQVPKPNLDNSVQPQEA